MSIRAKLSVIYCVHIGT